MGAQKRTTIDSELETLMSTLQNLQKQVGGGEKMNREAELRGGRGADLFMDIKQDMVAKLTELRACMTEQATNPTTNPKEQIALDAKIKRSLRQLSDEWHELEAAVVAEQRKRKSKVPADELATRQELVLRFLREIDDVKAAHRTGYSTATERKQVVERLAVVERADHELFRKKGEGGASSQQEEVTSEQQLRLQQIKQRDQRFDEHISQIGEGIDILAEMADQQNQEIQKQNVMLEDLQVRMDNVHEHVTNINVKMKGTLEKVSRSADKICVDMMCLMLFVGMIVILYQLLVSNERR